MFPNKYSSHTAGADPSDLTGPSPEASSWLLIRRCESLRPVRFTIFSLTVGVLCSPTQSTPNMFVLRLVSKRKPQSLTLGHLATARTTHCLVKMSNPTLPCQHLTKSISQLCVKRVVPVVPDTMKVLLLLRTPDRTLHYHCNPSSDGASKRILVWLA